MYPIERGVLHLLSRRDLSFTFNIVRTCNGEGAAGTAARREAESSTEYQSDEICDGACLVARGLDVLIVWLRHRAVIEHSADQASDECPLLHPNSDKQSSYH